MKKKIILWITFLYFNIFYLQSNDSICVENIKNIKKNIENVISSINNLSKNYWMYYRAPKWGAGFELTIIDLEKNISYKIETFKDLELKQKKINIFRRKKIHRINVGGNYCSIEMMDDSAEGFLVRADNVNIIYSYYFLGTVPIEVNNIINELDF